ncbi:ATP-binding cassette domain-containing protein [Mycoplasma enhydrae]|uniref:ATP-binding cassette domain-containing protein n=1 Tax=Mycoplasma enhydrae TaxID=2499220 RepID=UPI00197B1E35|nr:ATP-binding cassette domain-containing protein [Mycoplasma enhydrae]MBN4089320.1 ATP-binding cassette domain-containing protein [Mycoplasma enhydrae]MCV3733692.1 ATP-binding cassette domain-containing protein [Mycoplasma enhydrae]MCV3753651.1 ATP-binding cassette domain-containing protein [Mycoplasma enhydrae]
MTKIEFKDYSATYKKDSKLILDNVSLTIEPGQMIAIIGKSGAGKTTIFNAILKQLETKNGSLLINDTNIDDYTKKEWKNQLLNTGYLSQEPNLIDYLNVYENILHFYPKYKNAFLSFFKLLSKKQKEEIFLVLDKLNLLNKAYTKISELSGGQKQRVEIAKLLLKNVKLILADEPTSNLDIKTSKDIMSLLKEINKDFKTTVLVNIHDLNIIQKFFDTYIFIKEGKILKIGNPKSLSQKQIEKLYES